MEDTAAFSSLKPARGDRNPEMKWGHLCEVFGVSSCSNEKKCYVPWHGTAQHSNWLYILAVSLAGHPFSKYSQAPFVLYIRACKGGFRCLRFPIVQGCVCGLSLNAGTQDEVPRPAAIAAPWGWLERQIQFTFPLWALVWRVLRKLKTELLYNLAIPGIYPQKIMIWKGTCTIMLTAVLFMIAKTWKQPNVHGQRNG